MQFIHLVWKTFGFLDYFGIYFPVTISSGKNKTKQKFAVSLAVCLIKAQVAFGNLELTSLSILPSVISFFVNITSSENNHRSRKTTFCFKPLTLCIMRGEVKAHSVTGPLSSSLRVYIFHLPQSWFFNFYLSPGFPSGALCCHHARYSQYITKYPVTFTQTNMQKLRFEKILFGSSYWWLDLRKYLKPIKKWKAQNISVILIIAEKATASHSLFLLCHR